MNNLIQVPLRSLPHGRLTNAQRLGVDRNILIETLGGLGDKICAEPAIRFAIKDFAKEGNKVSIVTDHPELYEHLEPEELFDVKIRAPIYDDYLLLRTLPVIDDSDDYTNQFLSSMRTHCVDISSLCIFNGQMQKSECQVTLRPNEPSNELLKEIIKNKKIHVFVHAGKHWPSKTFPAYWWNGVIKLLQSYDFVVVLIGKTIAGGEGYVEVDPTGCIDLREKTTVSEAIWLLQNCQYLLSNDSSPIHMAASGRAHIGFCATVKAPEFITHYRNGGQFGWREQNFSLGGLWEKFSMCPNRLHDLKLDQCSEEEMNTYLPDPVVLADWVKEKSNEDF